MKKRNVDTFQFHKAKFNFTYKKQKSFNTKMNMNTIEFDVFNFFLIHLTYSIYCKGM